MTNTTSSDTSSKSSAKDTSLLKGAGIFLFFIILFIVLGIIAMIWSLICFGKSGTIVEKFIGLLIAFFLGPFYFIYYYANPSYCR